MHTACYSSCSQFNNLSWWNELVNATSKVPVLMENCHQGQFVPGMAQWQSYIRNASATSGVVYEHRLGYFSAGHDLVPPMHNTTYAQCKAQCDKVTCFGTCSGRRWAPPGALWPAALQGRAPDTEYHAQDFVSSRSNRSRLATLASVTSRTRASFHRQICRVVAIAKARSPRQIAHLTCKLSHL
jgi:hypothetical protein